MLVASIALDILRALINHYKLLESSLGTPIKNLKDI